jgi:hypothetical protein
MCQERHGIFSIEAMVRGYHVYKSIWAAAIGEEFEALTKNRYRDIITVTSAAALATACGIGQRSRVLEKNSHFYSFYFRIRDGAYKIYKK